MATETIVGSLEVPAFESHRWTSVLSDYWALTKPEVNFLILVTALAGFYLGRAAEGLDFPFSLAVSALFGTSLVASGTGTLNQYIERDFDALMRRTARRPLAAGRLKPRAVLLFGIALSVTGAAYLALAVSPLASLLAVVTLLSYLFFYTPLKRRSPLCMLVGAFPGAMPPLIGWAAATGSLSLQAWTLYAMLFLWQFPHFMAIAWMYREDYHRAGYLVLPQDQRPRLVAMGLQTLFPLLALVPLSLLPVVWGRSSTLYLVGALLLSLSFLYFGTRFLFARTSSAARRLLTASIIYLPLLFALMTFARALQRG